MSVAASSSLTNASMHLRLNPLDVEGYSEIAETIHVFPEVLFLALANYVPELSRSAAHYPTGRKGRIRPDPVRHDACTPFMKGIDLRRETFIGPRTRETVGRLFKILNALGKNSTR